MTAANPVVTSAMIVPRWGGDRHLLVLLMLCGFNVAQNDILELTNVLWTFKNCNKVGKYVDDPEATTVIEPR